MAQCKLHWILFALAALLACAVVARKYDADKTYVHIVPHTHDDVGWLKTVDQYFYGANKSIQAAAVQYILDTVIQELQLDPSRTFSYVEMAFFVRWWNQQSDDTKQVVKNLVKNKQLEFVNAGWCMNDEAGTHYNAIIDQMTLGLQFVEDNFGPDARPRVAWHIDPFGHSAEQAAIFSQMGFDGFFFARNDYDDRNQRLNDQTMEMVWRPSASLGAASDLFTGILYYGYGPPPGFCFDMRCGDDPIQDDPNLEDYNVEQKVLEFVATIVDQRKHYRSNHVMLTMGSDFQWESAREWFKNLDKLMKYTMNMTDNLELFYSTPSRYLDAVHDADLEWTIKTDDFFPYADNSYAYWTGYFSSRPALKYYTRKMNSLLQTCEQIWTNGLFLDVDKHSPALLEQAMGVDQHHDAVSGTEKQHVANDYAKRLHRGQVECTDAMADALNTFMTIKSGGGSLDLKYCEYLNVSVCEGSSSNSFDFVAYNPLGSEVMVPVVIPVSSDNLTVLSSTGKTMTVQIQATTDATKHAATGLTPLPYTLTFVDTLPAMGFRTYFVRPASKLPSKQARPRAYQKELKLGGADYRIGDDDYPLVLTFNGTTGHLKSINNTVSNLSVNIDQWYMWYNSSDGKNINSSQASGAYIFRPNGTQPFDVTPDGKVKTIVVFKGDVYMEMYQQFNSWLYQVVRVYKDIPLVQFQYTVGPIPFQDDLGKEIVSRFTTDLQTDGTWYTDANGREMQQRKRNFRPTWKYNNTEPVAGNYYPVNSRIYMRDEAKNMQVTVLTDRSQGGASLNDGQMELMVHRRTLYDDGRGVGEPINETGVDGQGLIIRGSHFLIFDNIEQSTIGHRLTGEAIMLRPEYMFFKDSTSPGVFMDSHYTNFSWLRKPLPLNVHLLTYKFMGEGELLLRLEHQFEADEGDLGKPVTVGLTDMFMLELDEVTELELGGNVVYPVQRLKWKTTSDETVNKRRPVVAPNYDVELKPMEIRTFRVTYKGPIADKTN